MVAPNTPVEIWELDDPVLEPGSVHNETVASEVCGTDVHLLHGQLSGVPYPIIPGHVSVGRILEAPGVEADARRIYFGPTPLGAAVAKAEGRRLEALVREARALGVISGS